MSRSTRPPIAITGATGHVGGAVARRLAEAGRPVRLLVRDPARAPRLEGAEIVVTDYEHQSANVEALSGVDSVLMTSLIGEDSNDHENDVLRHQDFIDAAVKAGEPHLVYPSFVGADAASSFDYLRQHGETEQYLRATDLPTTLVRANYFAETLLHFHHGEDHVRGPAGDGRLAAVARDDVAEALAAVLADPAPHAGKVYELTGSEAFDFHELAAMFSRIYAEPCVFEDETDEQARASRAGYGAPEHVLKSWLDAYVSIRHGNHGHVTDDLRHLIDREPTPIEDVLTRLAHSIEA